MLKEINIDNLILKLELRDKDQMSILPNNQIYELPILIHMKKILDTFNDDDFFIDVGAHIGSYSLLTTKGKCLAIEADRENAQMLYKNITLNNRFNVICLIAAASNKNTSYFVFPGDHSGLNQVIEDQGSYQTVVIDELFNEEKVRLIKIDCEGMDFEVIQGMEKIIKKNHPKILIEGKNQQEDIKKFLNRFDYTITQMGENLFAQ